MLKTLINIIGWLFLSSALLSLGFLVGWVVRVSLYANTPKPTVRDQMMSIQRQVGCVKIDAEIGPETTRKVNARVQEEERQICNQFAVECIKEALAKEAEK